MSGQLRIKDWPDSGPDAEVIATCWRPGEDPMATRLQPGLAFVLVDRLDRLLLLAPVDHLGHVHLHFHFHLTLFFSQPLHPSLTPHSPVDFFIHQPSLIHIIICHSSIQSHLHTQTMTSLLDSESDPQPHSDSHFDSDFRPHSHSHSHSHFIQPQHQFQIQPGSRSRSLSLSCNHSLNFKHSIINKPSASLNSLLSLELNSLDLPPSLSLALIALRHFLISHLILLESRLKSASILSQQDLDSETSFSSSDDEDVFQPQLRSPPNEPSNLSALVNQVSSYIHQLNSDLFHSNLKSSSLSPASALDWLSVLKLKDGLGCLLDCFAISDPAQLGPLLTFHSDTFDKLFSQLAQLARSLPPPSLPSSQPVSAAPVVHHKTPGSLRQYFAAESDRLASVLPAFPLGLSDSLAQSSSQLTSAFRLCRDEAQAVLHDGEAFIREEGERLKGWVDAEAEALGHALRLGASRLLTYHELPSEWKNNRYILSGYRFIPLDRWRELLLSGLQWHNETINIHTHFLGTLSLFYLLFFLWPTTPHTNPDSSTPMDRAISLVFLGCAIKCLLCSTAWHLFAGCGTLGPFRRLACVDYVGISGLIAASVMSMEYYGFYCRPTLAAFYMAFTTLTGAVGMVLPFQPFFDRPESKPIRIAFFVSMAGSALIPQAHMAYLYGFKETVRFYSPAIPSVISYLAGLVFYATNCPERIRPGWLFDTFLHSHQFWHVAIVLAIWLHWRAIGIIHGEGRSGFSCAVGGAGAAGSGGANGGGWLGDVLLGGGKTEL